LEIIYFAANTKDVELFILAPILVVPLPFEWFNVHNGYCFEELRTKIRTRLLTLPSSMIVASKSACDFSLSTPRMKAYIHTWCHVKTYNHVWFFFMIVKCTNIQRLDVATWLPPPQLQQASVAVLPSVPGVSMIAQFESGAKSLHT
jgi:hypothetical protein